MSAWFAGQLNPMTTWNSAEDDEPHGGSHDRVLAR